MRRAIILSLVVATVVLGLILGPRFLEYDGYILIVLESGTLQLSVFGFLLSVVGLTLGGWLAFVLVRYILRLVTGSTKWLSGFKGRKQKQAFTNGLIQLFTGELNTAQKSLEKIEKADFDGVNLLAAAEVELQLGETTKARELWFKASEYKTSRIAAYVGLCKSYINHQEGPKALSLINDIPENDRNDPLVVKVWAQALESCNNWRELKQKLPVWKKALGKDYQPGKRK